MAFVCDANVEFTPYGVSWRYSSPRSPLTVVVRTSVSVDEELQNDRRPEHCEGDDRSAFPHLASKVRCASLFIPFEELEERNVFMCTSIPDERFALSLPLPLSPHQQCTRTYVLTKRSKSKMVCRISLFPSGRIRLTANVSLYDVQAAWISTQELLRIERLSNPRFSVWDNTHVMDARNLLGLLFDHIDD